MNNSKLCKTLSKNDNEVLSDKEEDYNLDKTWLEGNNNIDIINQHIIVVTKIKY